MRPWRARGGEEEGKDLVGEKCTTFCFSVTGFPPLARCPQSSSMLRHVLAFSSFLRSNILSC